jgi:hypothetical protein
LSYLKLALKEVAHDADKASNYLQRIDVTSHPAALYLYLETIAANGEKLGFILLDILHESNIFETGPYGAEWLAFAQAAKAALPYLEETQKLAVEARILNYWDELEHAKKIAHDLSNGQVEDYYFGNRQTAIRYLNGNGYKQWCILKTIGSEYLSKKGKYRLALLERKFRKFEVAKPHIIEFNCVPPPIKASRAKFMTDAQWLKAMQAYDSDIETIRKNGQWESHTGAEGLGELLKQQTKENPERFAAFLLNFRLMLLVLIRKGFFVDWLKATWLTKFCFRLFNMPIRSPIGCHVVEFVVFLKTILKLPKTIRILPFWFGMWNMEGLPRKVKMRRNELNRRL